METSIGVRFFDKKDRSSLADLVRIMRLAQMKSEAIFLFQCSIDGCSMMSYRDLQKMFIGRSIEQARNVKQLEKQWKKAKVRK